jgi:hypothetical protein
MRTAAGKAGNNDVNNAPVLINDPAARRWWR